MLVRSDLCAYAVSGGIHVFVVANGSGQGSDPRALPGRGGRRSSEPRGTEGEAEETGAYQDPHRQIKVGLTHTQNSFIDCLSFVF